jgi:hypothetical protein
MQVLLSKPGSSLPSSPERGRSAEGAYRLGSGLRTKQLRSTALEKRR